MEDHTSVGCLTSDLPPVSSRGEAADHPEVEDPDDHQRSGTSVGRRSAQTAHLHFQHRPEGGVRHQVLPRTW